MQTKAKNTAVLIMVGLVVLCLYSYANAQTPISSVPVRITTPGSYCLTSDLQVTNPDSNAIVVDVDDVTIDLMGYNLIGPGSGQGRGIYINARANVEIRNGTIRDFGAEGIYEIGIVGPQGNQRYGYGHRIIDVRSSSNGSDGIYLFGVAHLIKDCTISENGNAGILVGSGSTITGNTILENVGDGLYASSTSTITGNTISFNGDDGIEASFGCMVSGNTVAMNFFFGIWVWDGCAVADNTVYSNGVGIAVSEDGSQIKSNMLRDNLMAGISIDGTSNSIEENLVTGSMVGFDFIKCNNFYANNRSAKNGTDYANKGCQRDGGGNVSF
jgi:parallel beta-helix repeat protein